MSGSIEHGVKITPRNSASEIVGEYASLPFARQQAKQINGRVVARVVGPWVDIDTATRQLIMANRHVWGDNK